MVAHLSPIFCRSISPSTVGTIMRKVIEMEQQGAGTFFGEPAFIGTPDEVYEGLAGLLQRSPCTHLVLMGVLPGAPVDGTRRSVELFAREVMPRLKQLSS